MVGYTPYPPLYNPALSYTIPHLSRNQYDGGYIAADNVNLTGMGDDYGLYVVDSKGDIN